MPTYTIYSDTSDGRIYCSDAAYAPARAGTGSSLAVDSTGDTSIPAPGQTYSSSLYYCLQAFMGFDTSVIPDGETVVSAQLDLGISTNVSNVDFIMEARLHDWGAGLTTADFVAGADLGSKTLLASLSTAGISNGVYLSWNSEAAFPANINKTGFTRMVIASANQRTNTPMFPLDASGDEFVYLYAGEEATIKPRLVVVTTLPGGMQMLL